MRKMLSAFFVLTLALVLASSGWGQSQITSGTVQGDVLDEKGGSVAGATVEAKNLATNFAQTDTTNTDGHFAFLSLAPGRYSVVARAVASGKCEPHRRANHLAACHDEGIFRFTADRRHRRAHRGSHEDGILFDAE